MRGVRLNVVAGLAALLGLFAALSPAEATPITYNYTLTGLYSGTLSLTLSQPIDATYTDLSSTLLAIDIEIDGQSFTTNVCPSGFNCVTALGFTDLDGDIWDLTYHGTNGTGGDFQSTGAFSYSNTNGHYTTGNYVFTGTSTPGDPPSSVPEAPSFSFMAAGLVLLAGMTTRRKKRSAAAAA